MTLQDKRKNLALQLLMAAERARETQAEQHRIEGAIGFLDAHLKEEDEAAKADPHEDVPESD